MPSVNEELQDRQISHLVDLSQYSNHAVRRIIGLLNRLDADLFAQLTAALDRLPAESFTVERLEQVLLSVRELNAQAYQQIGQELRQEMRDLANFEAEFQLATFRAALPAQVPLVAVNAEQVYAAALARPFQGRLLSEWSTSIEAGRMARIRDTVRMGYVEGQTTSDIVRRVRGTKARGYADGIIEIDRRGAESVVRTAVSHTAGFTRDRFYGANDGLIKAEQWLSTLDLRTSSACRLRDHLKYTPGDHKPIGHTIPWGAGPGRLHWCCRSTSTPITKSWKELGIALDDMPAGGRASMDGTVPADTTYSEWLKRQSAARQDEVLGPTRGLLFRKGELPLSAMYTSKGTFLSLAELRQRHRLAA